MASNHDAAAIRCVECGRERGAYGYCPRCGCYEPTPRQPRGVEPAVLTIERIAMQKCVDVVRGVRCYLAGEGSLRDLWDYVRGYEV